jgi:hypothetical protein
MWSLIPRREQQRIRYKSRLGEYPSGVTGWPGSMSAASRPLIAGASATYRRCLDQGSLS